MESYANSLTTHYSRRNLGGMILQALKAAGKDINSLTLRDLHPIDEFHSMGLKATHDLVKLGQVAKDDHMLDLGCGIGGPARTLASETGCRVTGIDFINEYVEAATMLTERVGLQSQVEFRQANAIELPFPDNTFDIVWSQHVIMNIPDKDLLVREIARVLQPGGRYVFQEVCSGSCGDVLFPVPWAGDAKVSFLTSPEEFVGQLARAGLRQAVYKDVTAAAFDWFQQMIAKGGPPAASIAILMGDDAQEKIRNLAYNYEHDCICMLQGVYTRP